MTDEQKTHDDRLVYEAPQAMRLSQVHAGEGQCEPGSGDFTWCYYPGNDALGDCFEDGVGATGSCMTDGISATGGCGDGSGV